jgi:hypothetical protein
VGETLYRCTELAASCVRMATPAGRLKHIALFKFHPECTPAEIDEVWRVIADLPKKIPGILDFSWGPDASVEGLSDGFSHSFIFTFENVAARDAYLPHPVHQAAVAVVLPKLARVIVIDHVVSP